MAMSGRSLRNAAFAAWALGALAFAAACRDTSPLPFVLPDAGLRVTDGGCLDCILQPNDLGGCLAERDACLLNTKCAFIYACSSAKGCFEEIGVEGKLRCGLPCGTEAGVVDLGDPSIDLMLQALKCAQGGCKEVCALGDGGLDGASTQAIRSGP